tara:strand:+ start:210 stop:551 length:342 start_codon:yes stop_codon:yes gene_type:complete
MIKFQSIVLKSEHDLNKIPNSFLGKIDKTHIGKIAVFFKADSDDVVTSRQLDKILSKLDLVHNDYLILTNNLTTEGIDLLKINKISCMTNSDFLWTDYSYALNLILKVFYQVV